MTEVLTLLGTRPEVIRLPREHLPVHMSPRR